MHSIPDNTIAEQIRQDPNKYFPFQNIITFVTNFFDYIHSITHSVTSYKSDTSSITYLYLLFDKWSNLNSGSPRPCAEANKDLPIGRCFALGTFPPSMPPCTNPEECLGRFLHKKRRHPRQRTISSLPIRTCPQGSQTTSFWMCMNVMETLSALHPEQVSRSLKKHRHLIIPGHTPCFLPRSHLQKRVS